MRTFEDQINEDVLCLKHYFEKMFILLEEANSDESKVPIVARDSTGPYTPRVQISHLIKPDMLINIYALFDYWIKRLCDNKKEIYNLELGWKDIKGKHNLHTYHKYLTKYVGMSLDGLGCDYQGIDNLRVIRNKIIHHGSHVLDEREGANMNKRGITVTLGTLVICDEFVWSSLEHVGKYLIGITKQ